VDQEEEPSKSKRERAHQRCGSNQELENPEKQTKEVLIKRRIEDERLSQEKDNQQQRSCNNSFHLETKPVKRD
jgi:hypothetical protein